ncbi:hypothetical protein Efla_003183 [Eimeria flavescens]
MAAAAGPSSPVRGAALPAACLSSPQQQQQQKQKQQQLMRKTPVTRIKAAALLPLQAATLVVLLLLLWVAAAAAVSARALPLHAARLPQQQRQQQQQQRRRPSGFLSASASFGSRLGLLRGPPRVCVFRTSAAGAGPPPSEVGGRKPSQQRWAPTWRPLRVWRRSFFGERRLRVTTEEQMDRALARGVSLASLEVCGDLHPPSPPFNPVLLLRLQLLLQQLLNSDSSSNSWEACRTSLTRWLCGRTGDPEAFKRGASRLLQQCTSLLEQHVHPVALLLYRRRLLRGPSGSGEEAPPGWSSVLGSPYLRGLSEGLPREDGSSLALAIEGGAMRGSVCAGMAVCLHWLGFSEAFDAVYGSSAGAMVGAFLLSRQLAYEGTCVYTDWLPRLGKHFIDVKRIGRALGLGCLLDGDLLDLLGSRLGKPLLNLNALLVDVLQDKQPFRFAEFSRNNAKQPLKIIASGLSSFRSVTLESANGTFKDLPSLCECLRASMLLPGMAGPVVHLPVWGSEARRGFSAGVGNGGAAAHGGPLEGAPGAPPDTASVEGSGAAAGLSGHAGGRGPSTQYAPVVSSSALPRLAPEAPLALVTEPLADALLFEPLPYRSAIADNNSHVLVLRSRPDNTRVGRLSGLEAAIELQMARRFFLRKHDLRPVFEHIRRRAHREIYMRDMLRLNAATNNLKTRISGSAGGRAVPLRGSPTRPLDGEPSHGARQQGSRGPTAFAMAVAVGGEEKETHKLKADRLAILKGVRGGFAALWETLQPEPSLRGLGQQEALKMFPDDMPVCPALGGPPRGPPPAYESEASYGSMSPAELAEYALQAAAASASQGPRGAPRQ